MAICNFTCEIKNQRWDFAPKLGVICRLWYYNWHAIYTRTLTKFAGGLLFTWLLFRINHWRKSPWATYSVIRRSGLVVVQQPRKLRTFWCFPTFFMSSISARNSLRFSSVALSKISLKVKKWDETHVHFHNIFSEIGCQQEVNLWLLLLVPVWPNFTKPAFDTWYNTWY